MWVYWRQFSHNLLAICAIIWQAQKTFAKHTLFLYAMFLLTESNSSRQMNRRAAISFRSLETNQKSYPVYETKPITTLYHSLNPQTARDRMTLSTRDFTTVEFRHVARFLKKRYKRSYCCFAEWITSFPLWPAAMGVV